VVNRECYSIICPERFGNISKDIRPSGRVLNQWSLEYEAGWISIRLQRFEDDESIK
jgi:hypothetical protein